MNLPEVTNEEIKQLFTKEELKVMLSKDEYYELFKDEINASDSNILSDIPEVKKSKLNKVKDFLTFRSKKVNNDSVYLDLDNDIPEVKKTFRERFNEWNIERKEKKQINKNALKETKKLKKESKKGKNDLIKAFVKCAFSGVLTCVAFAGALITASSVFTIGFLPALAITACFVAGGKLMDSAFKKDIVEFKEVRENNIIEKEVEENKTGFFKGLKNRFSKKKQKNVVSSNQNELDVEEFLGIQDINEPEEDFINVDELLGGLEEKEISKTKPAVNNLNVVTTDLKDVKLTREENIAKVKKECKLGYVKLNGVTTYFVTMPKEDIKLRKFIRNEYKKQYPKEKVQYLEVEDKKVLVLGNRPSFK